jgi:hypothetical protein
MDEKLLSTIVELARLGAVGVGAIVLLLAFFLLWKAKGVEPESAKLINRYMTLGFIFAVAAGVLGLVPLFFGSSGGPVPVRLSFSPNFATQKISPPLVEAPDGSQVQPGQTFTINPSKTTQTIAVGVDEALKDFENLKSAAERFSASAAESAQQTKVLAEKVAEIAPAQAPAAEATVDAETQKTQQLHAEVLSSIRSGDYARASTLSTQLRSSVLKTDRAVTEIARRR